MSCLGPRLADLADGRLNPAENERALAHVARCDRCRTALSAQRAARDMLTQTGPLELPKDLFSRLVQLPAAEPANSAASSTYDGADLAPHSLARRSFVRRHPARTAVVVGGGAAIAMAVAWGGAGTASVTPSSAVPLVVPAVDAFDAEHALSTENLALSGPAVTAVEVAYRGSGVGSIASTTAQPAASRTP